MKSSSRYSGVQQMHLIVKIKVTKKMRPAWATHSKKKEFDFTIKFKGCQTPLWKRSGKASLISS